MAEQMVVEHPHLERTGSLVGTTILGKYRIDRLLGVGGTAAVYAATHRNGRRVAIKKLHPGLAECPDVRQRFVREGLATNAVQHPGIVTVIDDDVTEDGSPFLVMELLVGQTVSDLWESCEYALPTYTVLSIARDVCDALAAAHERGVIHRDIKPANLFVTEDGRVKVLDFGIASLRDLASPALTEQGTLMGTPWFLAPEQAAGLISQLDERTDLWAVGALMFTLLAGRPVHDGESGRHVAMLAATRPAPSLASVLPHASRSVAAVVDRALKLDKRERWRSALEMRDAISAVMGEPLAEAPPPPESSRRGRRALEMPDTILTRARVTAKYARPDRIRAAIGFVMGAISTLGMISCVRTTPPAFAQSEMTVTPVRPAAVSARPTPKPAVSIAPARSPSCATAYVVDASGRGGWKITCP